MKHTECKDCALGNGDCGHHFEMDGVTNYDIASLSACDKYGNCMFFKAKAKPQDKRISSEALKEVINDLFRSGEYDCNSVLKAIDDAQAVPSYTLEDLEKAKNNGYKWGKKESKDNEERINQLVNELNSMKKQLLRLCFCLYPQALGEDGLKFILTEKQEGGSNG